MFTNERKVAKNLFYYSLAFLVFAISFPFLKSLFDKFIVDWLICQIYQRDYGLFVAFATVVFFFYGLYAIVIYLADTKYVLKTKSITFASLPLLLYILDRIIFDFYQYSTIFRYGNFMGFKLLDVFNTLYFIFLATLTTNKFKRQRTSKDNFLHIDIPLNIVNQDEYDRKEVYAALITQLSGIDFREDKSFCLGIVNSWGDGKTSFLNFLGEELVEDKDTVLINFNAWLSENSENLTLDFFHTLESELSNYIYFGSTLRNYAQNLTAIESEFNPMKYIPNNWIGHKSHREAFNDINHLIKKLNKRIFVFIDDLDRLDNKEVFNLLRTVRNTANFSNMHFVIPFDKDYVTHAIVENKIYNPVEYLKKIFDVEIVLPPISRDRLQGILINLLEDLISNKLKVNESQRDAFKTQFEWIIYGKTTFSPKNTKYNTVNIVLFKYLKNKRDIIRFFNALVLSLKANYEWTYLPDLVILEMLKIYGHQSYNLLFQNDFYLGNKNDENGRQYYILKNDREDSSDDFIEEFIARRESEYAIDERVEDDDIRELIRRLFELPENGEFMAKYALVYKSNFANYFQYRENGIKFDDIEDMING